MTNLYQKALEIKDQIAQDRRYLHAHPETGLGLPKTSAYVEKRLKEMGYEPVRLGASGVKAVLGKKPGKTFLIRGDMDALPVKEESQVDFKSTNENMHGCGHDFHASGLLGAAQLLKDHEDELQGQVVLMFQPAEETMQGAHMMIQEGILENPKVDAAMAIHVFPNMPLPTGTVIMPGANSRFASVDWFTIDIQGKGCHGAQPHNGVDPLNVMSHIHLALQEINARELDPTDNLVLTVGQMHGGNTSNVIPDTATMSGTIRTLKNETRTMVKKRMEEMVSGIAQAFGATAQITWGASCPVLLYDHDLYASVKGYLRDLEGVSMVDYDETGDIGTMMGSEDFAYVASAVPSVFLMLTAGQPQDGYCYPVHHPKALFDEDALAVGAATYAHVAMSWLRDHQD